MTSAPLLARFGQFAQNRSASAWNTMSYFLRPKEFGQNAQNHPFSAVAGDQGPPYYEPASVTALVANPGRRRVRRPAAMSKRSLWTGQAKADVRSIERRTALQVLRTPARYARTGRGNTRQLQGLGPPPLPESGRVACLDLPELGGRHGDGKRSADTHMGVVLVNTKCVTCF